MGENAPELPAEYFGSKSYYQGEPLQAEGSKYEHKNGQIIEAKNGIKMWSLAIDVRRSKDPQSELPLRGLHPRDDKVLFHYTDAEAFQKITSIQGSKVFASMAREKDSNFGNGVYATKMAPHEWRSQEEVLLNNYFPSKKDWEADDKTKHIEWPPEDALCSTDAETAERLLKTPLGQKLLEKFKGKSEYSIPIVCDIHGAKDVMKKDTDGALMPNGEFRPAGHNRHGEKEPVWRDVWLLQLYEAESQEPGELRLRLQGAGQPPDLMKLVLQNRERLAGDVLGRFPNTMPVLHDSIYYKALFLADADSCGWDLHKAAEVGRADVAQVLLDAGADKDRKYCDGHTALHAAAYYGHVEAVQALLAAGAAVDATGNYGAKPLHYAASNGHFQIVRALVVHGALPDAETVDGSTPEMMARLHGHTEIAKYLEAPPAPVDLCGWSLHKAAEKGKTDILQALLDGGADKEQKNERGDTALHRAAEGGHVEAVEALLAAGAAVNSIGFISYTPLHNAAIQGHLDVARALVAHGASLAAKDHWGRTPAAWARNSNRSKGARARGNGHTAVAEFLEAEMIRQGTIVEPQKCMLM